jgi:hypothetical protein
MASMLLYGRKSKFCLSVADSSFDFFRQAILYRKLGQETLVLQILAL